MAGAEASTEREARSGADAAAQIGLLEGLATTRAIRRYLPESIPDEDLASILWHASRAPSGSNRQMFRFVVLRDGPAAQQAKALLGQCFRDGWNAKRTGDGYTQGSGAADDSPKARMARTMQHFVDHFEETPVVILACLVRYRKPNYAEGASVYPAVQNLLLAARGARLRRCDHRLASRRRRRAARSARHPRGCGDPRHHPARAARRAPRSGAATAAT